MIGEHRPSSMDFDNAAVRLVFTRPIRYRSESLVLCRMHVRRVETLSTLAPPPPSSSYHQHLAGHARRASASLFWGRLVHRAPFFYYDIYIYKRVASIEPGQKETAQQAVRFVYTYTTYTHTYIYHLLRCVCVSALCVAYCVVGGCYHCGRQLLRCGPSA